MKEDSAKKAWELILEALPHSNDYRIWSDGDEILCENEQISEHIADLIDAMFGGSVCVTGYYDPAEDAKEERQFASTGFYYVNVC